MILIAASAKSAQLPFTAWLPRAMEGPTPSSAIFYGSLSVHIGAFLLMRTFPFWEHQVLIRWLTAAIGLSTAIIASQIARVQTTVKSQVAYSSASQIGIIFVEIAAGFEILALVHFAGNAFLRTYQLLISPSVVTYMIREQFYRDAESEQIVKSEPLSKLRQAAYIMALKEWHLDSVIFTLFFKPLKGFKNILSFLSLKNLLFFLIPFYSLGIYLVYSEIHLTQLVRTYLATGTALLALILVVKAYNERQSARFAWLLIICAHFLIDLAVTFNDQFDRREAAIYLSGIALSGLLGYYSLFRVKRYLNKSIDLHDFHGLVYQLPGAGLVFLFSALGLAGFPITTTFIGEDIILTHIEGDQVLLALFVALSFIIIGIALIRMYARVFLGSTTRNFQHKSDITS
jgi:NADH:ubiquinone oxidoreductase subunit 4 (subunit M)